MKKEFKEVFKNRFKSFLWRLCGMIVIMGFYFLIDNATLLNLPPIVPIILGLIAGEITKYLNIDVKKLEKKKVVEN